MVAADEENVHDNPAAEPLPEPAAVAEETPMETPHPDGDSPPMETPPPDGDSAEMGPPRRGLPPEIHDRIARRAPRAVVTEGPLNVNRVLACSCSRLAWLSPMTVDSGAMRAFGKPIG